MRQRPEGVTRRTFGAQVAALGMFGFAPAAAAQGALPPGRSLSAAEEQANVAVVNAFCAAFGEQDLTKALSLLADNCTYRTVQTRPAAVGKDAVTKTITSFFKSIVEFKVLTTVVINERDDVITLATGGTRTFRIAAGMFFVENGKIVEWTDYMVLS